MLFHYWQIQSMMLHQMYKILFFPSTAAISSVSKHRDMDKIKVISFLTWLFSLEIFIDTLLHS